MLTDLGEKNTSSSVTNSIEYLCESLVKRGVVPNGCTFIEHYEGPHSRHDTFNQVSFNADGAPDWRSLNLATVQELLSCEATELIVPTINSIRLLGEIEKIRNEIDPFIDSPWPENPAVINRRHEIESKMIGKRAIAELVQSGATEQELQRLLKADLSVFAEIYADPKEEYICFSEFPVADGSVDFAVFSGRSRMDVILIEVVSGFGNPHKYGCETAHSQCALESLNLSGRPIGMTGSTAHQ